MSQHYSVVVILRSGQWTLDETLRQLASSLQPGVATPRWEARPLDEHCTLVADAVKALPGPWQWLRARAFDYVAAVWTPSATSVHRGDNEGIRVVDHYLSSALTLLRPVFEYFSILSEHAERGWMETVFAQLRSGDWESLLRPEYERMLLPPQLGDRFMDHPRWKVLENEDAGVLVQTREL